MQWEKLPCSLTGVLACESLQLGELSLMDLSPKPSLFIRSDRVSRKCL